MTALSLDSVSVALSKHTIINNVSFDLPQGSIGCLLGTSGSGKTTLLRAIAGFEPITHGTVYLGEHKASTPSYTHPIEKRHIGMVFQDLALFPHLNVFDNIAFALKNQTRKTIKTRVQHLLSLVELEHRATHFPHQLSGGQQQRVALARALAPKPNIILLDEPFSSIDDELHTHLAIRIRDILKAESVTGLLVTHNQEDAFSMADYVGLVHNKTLLQWGTPYEVYHMPNSTQAAKMLGEGRLIQGQIVSDTCVHTALGKLHSNKVNLTSSHAIGDAVQVFVRPEDIIHDDDSAYKLPIKSKTFRGSTFIYTLDLSGDDLLCLAPSHHDHSAQKELGIRLELEHLLVF